MNRKTEVSIIVPVRDEEKNIPIIFSKMPQLANKTETIFVEGGSKDKTWEIAQKYSNRSNRHKVFFRTIKQIGKGKGNAVRTGFNKAKGNYLIIYDGDMTISEKDLKKFIIKIDFYSKKNKEAVIIGDRLSLKREKKSMKLPNFFANIFFATYYSFLLKNKINDCCCGTKTMTKNLWKKIEKIRKKEGDLDDWGDIDLMYYGRRAGAVIDSVKVHYLERIFGQSKMQSWKLGYKMFMIGLTILKNNLQGNKYA